MRAIGVLAFSAFAGAAPASGPAVARPADPGQSLVVQKVLVAECRAVRGFLGSPVDGTVNSRDYRGTVREYPQTASDGVAYSYNRNDGLHLTLADDEGFDLVVVRGGAQARLYAEANTLTEPKNVQPLWAFAGGDPVQRAHFGARVKARNVSFFGVVEGTLADVSFYRLKPGHVQGTQRETWRPGQSITLEPPATEFAPESLPRALKERYGDRAHRVLGLGSEVATNAAVSLAAQHQVHFVSASVTSVRGLAAVGLAAVVTGNREPCVLTCVVQDPLNPRLDLTWLQLPVPASGRVQWVIEVPDQVLLPGSRLWVTLSCDQAVTLAGPDGGAPHVHVHFVSREQALPEALAWRKFQLRMLFSKLSEPRPWGAFRQQLRDEFFRSSPYARQCPELFMTLDQCHTLAPADNEVRQYREWVYVNHLDRLSEIAPPPPPPPGVPPWAWYPRLAWLETRRIAEWWLDHRSVETGEFGGRVGDDSDMYQQYADLPFFESDGVGERLRAAAARLAELAEQENLRAGVNRHATDALHAYEEGINHLALMARWCYGDPVYLERCLESARSMEALTIRTPDGRRHFRDASSMGARDLDQPHPPAVDGHAAPLMWHAALQAADYHRHPRALQLLREWADTWLRFQKPGEWATAVEVKSGRVVAAEKDRPLYGGYRTQAGVFTWLAAMTGDARYVGPLLHYQRQGKAPLPVGAFSGDCWRLGFLDGVKADALQRLVPSSPELALYLNLDAGPLVQATIGHPRSTHAGIGSLYDAQRWPDMYTRTEQFTDRVFPDLLEHASIAYLGGWTRRNKFNPTLAVSWEGFGTNYAALVLRNRRDHLKLVAYNFAPAALAGHLRPWALEHGRYRLTVGPADGDTFAMARIDRTETLEISRADRLPLTLPPGRVTLFELRQREKLDDLFQRADLAISAREVQRTNTAIVGWVHNLGAASVETLEVALMDANGRTVASRRLGPLAAPLDLVPKRIEFTFPLPANWRGGGTVMVDPQNRLPEIFEGNNAAPVP